MFSSAVKLDCNVIFGKLFDRVNLAIVGTRGIPNNYGGFETLAEYLAEYLSREMKVTVYCSSRDLPEKLREYKGARLKYIPVSSHGALGIIYDSLSLAHALFEHDKVLFLGFGAGFIIPFFGRFKSKIILNIGGLDWQRSKWSPRAQKVIKKAEALLVKYSGTVISDNPGIRQYLLKEYGRESDLIFYGGDQASPQPKTPELIVKYPFLQGDYAFSVLRIQQDNNVEMILEAFSQQNKIPIVMVGNWDNSGYGLAIKSKFAGTQNIILIDAIYNRQVLDVLRSNCTLYIHGHSAGGTNPSLAEAMFLGLPVFAFASGYNEYTTQNKALYFKTADELTNLVKQYKLLALQPIAEDLKQIAHKYYRWKLIAQQYKEVILR